MNRFRSFGPVSATMALAILSLAGYNSHGQVAERRPVTNEYHGVKVVDPYQWLENAADPAVREWSAAQNTKARHFLDELPARAPIEDRLTRLLTLPSTNYFGLNWRKGKLFLMKFEPPAQQAMLVSLAAFTNLASE